MTSTGRRGYVGVDRRWLANPDLTDPALRLMLWLDSHTHEYLRDLGVKRMSAETGWSRNRIKRAIDCLEGLDLITVEQVPHRDPNKTQTRVTIHHEEWSDRGPQQTPGGVRNEAQGGVRNGAPTTSNPNVEESSSGTPKPPATTDVEVVPEWEMFFIGFWEVYPRKVGKPAAKRAIKKAWDRGDAINIVEGTGNWCQYWRESRTDEQFIPHPATFLNQERYNDPAPQVSAPKLSKAEEAIERIRNRDQ